MPSRPVLTRLASLLTLVLLAAAAPASAQTELTAGIRGAAVDTAGAPIAGATVAVTSAALGASRLASTDGEGRFAVSGLTPANDYVVAVSAEGFRAATRDGLGLVSGQALAVDFALEPLGVAESVTVTADSTPIVSDAPEVSQVVGGRQLAELPSNGRNLNRFALLDPHVRNPSGLGADGSTSSRLSINASSFRQTFYKLDGNNNYDFVYANAPQQQVPLLSVQEFKVLTNQYSAEYGGSSAGVVSAVTKSGGADFHGEAYFTGRPSGIQAAAPLAKFRMPNELLQFGGSAGGPTGVDGLSFFASYEQSLAERGAFVQSPAPLVHIGHGRDALALARLDYQLNDTHSMSLRLNGHASRNDNPNDRVSGFVQPSAATLSRSQAFGAQLTDRTIWGSAVNELRASYVNAIPSSSRALDPQVSVVRTDYATSGGSGSSWARTQTLQLADQIALTAGAHDLKLGGDYTRQTVRDFSTTAFGEYTFAPGAPRPGELPISYTQRFGTALVDYGQHLASGFVQDNWRATSRLTLNLGLRYDHQSITDDRNNVAPRLGFAWNVFGDGRTVLRGGAGAFYDQYYMYISRRFILEGLEAPIQAYRFTYGATTTPGAPEFPGSLVAPPSGATPLPRDYVYLAADELLNPSNRQYSLGVQQELPGGFVLTVDAIHSRTTDQMRVNDINAPAPFVRTGYGQVLSPAVADATRPFGTVYEGVPVRKVIVVENTASSTYDALDVGVVRRLASRYQVEAHYVYSSALTTSMFFGEPDTGVPNVFGAPETLERGPSDFHQRHRFVAHGLLDLPFRSRLSFVATLASGLPVNPLTGVDNNGDGYRADRPAYFGRNSFRTPNQATVDASFAKRFDLGEGTAFEVRADVFNVFNRNNFIKLNATYGDGPEPAEKFLTPIAGIANTDPGRQIQFGARFLF